ncbi:type II toxin-antitoxin system RelE/ParE family toxin [Rhizobium mayense]|uniref:Type II toxin-antitoxin system RelE/ParE family toxin n=1 Tax=Rhizobium mayense TaxID=1312184 RepID=A0ABT7JLR6_9HYPH|nr:type II toxin-antitoxin system RelE/ParE family toxin [Rhizobium mayense]MDL2397291.1 type II toxin-antitoxin system RelE/ParE family toxin [Rhizobium mayense]
MGILRLRRKSRPYCPNTLVLPPQNDATTGLEQKSALCDFPAQGKVGRIASTRELVLVDFPYVLVYRATEQTLEVLTVMHTSQRWPARF